MSQLLEKPKFNPEFGQVLEDILTKEGAISECYLMFHEFSITNQFFACWQLRAMGLPIKPIANAKTWAKQGRTIQEKYKNQPIWLRRPITTTHTEINEDGEEVTSYNQFYPFKPYWYSLSQTECKENKKVWKLRPNLNFDIDKVIKANGIKVIEFESLNGNGQGYCYPKTKEMAINPIAENPLKTQIHEIAHILLGHHDDDMPRSLHELEAESVAYIVMSVFGADDEILKKMRGYIQNWFKGSKIPDKNAQRIMRVANDILKAGLGK